MKSVKFFSLFCLVAFLIWTGCDNKGSSKTSDPTVTSDSTGRYVEATVDIVSLFWNHPAVKVLQAISIISEACEPSQDYANKDCIHFKTTNPRVYGTVDTSLAEGDSVTFKDETGEFHFSPTKLIEENNLMLKNEAELSQFEATIDKVYTECTDEALDSGEGNHLKLIEIRLACFEARGFSANTLNYWRAKNEN